MLNIKLVLLAALFTHCGSHGESDNIVEKDDPPKVTPEGKDGDVSTTGETAVSTPSTPRIRIGLNTGPGSRGSEGESGLNEGCRGDLVPKNLIGFKDKNVCQGLNESGEVCQVLYARVPAACQKRTTVTLSFFPNQPLILDAHFRCTTELEKVSCQTDLKNVLQNSGFLAVPITALNPDAEDNILIHVKLTNRE